MLKGYLTKVVVAALILALTLFDLTPDLIIADALDYPAGEGHIEEMTLLKKL